MFENYGAESICDVDKWSKWTEGNRKGFPEESTFEKSRIENLKKSWNKEKKRGVR